jgi:histone deacetylase 6
MTHGLMGLANGKVVACLEVISTAFFFLSKWARAYALSQGGYALDAISECALSVVRTLNGDPPERLSIRGPPSEIAVNDVRNVLKWHAQYWMCLSEYREPGTWAS